MGRTPCCDKSGLKKGPWTPEEDQMLVDYIQKHGYGNWRTLPKNAGLQRCGKSCRLRWTNYLRPDIKRGRFSFEEEETIIQLHSILGNKWSAIASRLPGRTDNEIKNYWNTHIRKRLLRMGIDPVTHSPRLDLLDLSSVLTSSLYGSSSSHINMLGMQPLQVNPELLKLASSLFSSSSSSSSHQHQHQDLHNYNNITSAQIQNQIPQSLQIQDSAQPNCVSTLPFNQQALQFVESNNVDPPYPSNFHDFGSPQQQYYSHNHLSDNWHYYTNGIASTSSSTYVTDDQLPSYNNNSNNYYCSTSDHNNHANLVDPPMSETSTFHSNSSNNQNLSFASVSTPSSSPKPLNANSTYVNGSNTEDERESYVSSNNNVNMLRFEIPADMLDVNVFM